MFPRSRLVTLAAVGALLLAVGCNGENPAGTDDNGGTTKINKGKPTAPPAVGAGFKGLVELAGKPAKDAKVKVVDQNFKDVTIVSTATADAAGKFSIRPVPDRVYFVMAEIGGQKLAGVVLPVEAKNGKTEPEIKLSAASTLSAAGVQPLFGDGGAFDLRDLSVKLFEDLVKAVEAAKPEVDLTQDVKKHLEKFNALKDKDAGVKAAYEAIFGDLRKKFIDKNGSPPPTPAPTPTPSASPSPSTTPTPSPSPGESPSPSASPSAAASESPAPSASPTGTPEPTPVPTPTPNNLVLVNSDTALSGQVDGADVKVTTSGYIHMLGANLAGTQVLMIPDGSRIWVLSNPPGGGALDVKLVKLGTALNAGSPPTVADVRALVFDGAKFHCIGRVDDQVKLLTLTVDISGNFSATATALSGDTPGDFAGHVFYAGHIYVASPNGNKIFKVNPADGASTLFGGNGQPTEMSGPADFAASTFKKPAGLALKDKGMYIAEVDGNRILRADFETGKVGPYAGSNPFAFLNGPLLSAKFSIPVSLFVDGTKMVVADQGNKAVREIDLDRAWVATLTTSADSNGKDLVNFVKGVGKLGTKFYALETNGTIRPLSPK